MSSNVVLVEQRPPFIIMLATRVPTYSHAIISLLAVLLFQAFPSWAIAKPPVRNITRKRRSSSLTSNATTLVDPDEAKHSKKHHHVSFSPKIPFNRLGSSVKMVFSRSKSMSFKPRLPRRLSLPARRLSSSVITAFHHLTPHHHHNDQKVDSYFPEKKIDLKTNNVDAVHVVASDPPANEVSVPAIVDVVAQPQTEDASGVIMTCAPPPPTKMTKFKRTTRRASIILGIAHRS